MQVGMSQVISFSMSALAISRQLIEPGCQKNEKQQLFLPQSLHWFNRRSASGRITFSEQRQPNCHHAIVLRIAAVYGDYCKNSLLRVLLATWDELVQVGVIVGRRMIP